MTFAEVNTMLSGVGIPTAYYQFTADTSQAPPFICFMYVRNNDFIADNTNYGKIEHLVIELYTDNKDFDMEARVENVLKTHNLVYTREETALNSERMYEVIFETDVMITEE